MILFYVKQDNTVAGCGEDGCCGPTYEDVAESFVDLEEYSDVEVTGEVLQSVLGGGPVLEFREASDFEAAAYRVGFTDGYGEAWIQAHKFVSAAFKDKIMKMQELDVTDLNVLLTWMEEEKYG